MDDLLLIILILIAIWYWWDTQQCNEIAFTVCQQKCAKLGFQLLDATVTRQKVWLRRTNNGGLQICRLYSFEYNMPAFYSQDTESASADFGVRENGYIVLISKQVVETNMPHEKPARQIN